MLMNTGQGRAVWVHFFLTAYNGMIVILLAAFMGITQEKIINTMGATSFLQQAPALPAPASQMFWGTLGAFVLLSCCGYAFSHKTQLSNFWRGCLFCGELIICLILMRNINLAYDGIVLLLVADLMYSYEGRNQLIIMMFSMAMIYGFISYNVSLLHMEAVPFSLYVGYYNHSLQNILMPLKTMLTYGNTTIFVIYMVVLLQDKRRENEKVAALNRQLTATNNQLNQANRKLREYAMTIASLTEIKERNRLAREIHDTLGHALTGIVAGLDACLVTLEVAPEVTKKQLAKIRAAAQQGMTDVRRSMHMLRPNDLEKLSIQEALTKMVHDFSDTSGMLIDLQIVGFPKNLREDQSEVLYRILQEGMTNASRHGHAKHVGISLVGDAEKLAVTIADDGIGCADIKSGFGLHHMQERIDMLGGSLNYWSEKGFVLEVVLPLNRKIK